VNGLVGLLGGTFDPPHLGHVELARTALRELSLARLVVVVVGAPPHKPVDTDAETRFRLAEAAFRGLPHVELSRHELDRAGRSYTVDTARWAHEELGESVWIVGADEFADFPTWRNPDEVLDHVRLAVATRPGFERERMDEVLKRFRNPDRVTFFDLEPIPISSRDIRARVAGGEPIARLVPGAVEALIAELDLYRET